MVHHGVGPRHLGLKRRLTARLVAAAAALHLVLTGDLDHLCGGGDLQIERADRGRRRGRRVRLEGEVQAQGAEVLRGLDHGGVGGVRRARIRIGEAEPPVIQAHVHAAPEALPLREGAVHGAAEGAVAVHVHRGAAGEGARHHVAVGGGRGGIHPDLTGQGEVRPAGVGDGGGEQVAARLHRGVGIEGGHVAAVLLEGAGVVVLGAEVQGARGGAAAVAAIAAGAVTDHLHLDPVQAVIASVGAVDAVTVYVAIDQITDPRGLGRSSDTQHGEEGAPKEALMATVLHPVFSKTEPKEVNED